jgi:aldehyde dehydrogenase
VKGQYFDNISPIDGKPFTKAARSDAADVNLAIDAAHKAQKTWGKTPAAQRRYSLNVGCLCEISKVPGYFVF